MPFDHLLNVGKDTGVETIPIYPGLRSFVQGVESRVGGRGGWRPVGTDVLEAFAIGGHEDDSHHQSEPCGICPGRGDVLSPTRGDDCDKTADTRVIAFVDGVRMVLKNRGFDYSASSKKIATFNSHQTRNVGRDVSINEMHNRDGVATHEVEYDSEFS